MNRTSNPPATISLDEAGSAGWDIVVVGAGPAGAMAALTAARSGLRVLLVEKEAFPRYKVCGCCLNRAALRVLREAGLERTLWRSDAQPLNRMVLQSADHRARLAMPRAAALSRERLDALLVEAAITSGAAFLAQTKALLRAENAGADDGVGVLPADLDLWNRGRRQRLQSRLLVVADGLGGGLLKSHPGFRVRVARASRIGAGTTIPDMPGLAPPGSIRMLCGQRGYVGLVQTEDERLTIGAALDPLLIRRERGLPHAIRQIMLEAGVETPPALARATWRGTPPLTRRRRPVARENVFVVGDASGYVEPFTGEGIAWGLEGGAALGAMLAEALGNDARGAAQCWRRAHRRLLAVRQLRCGLIARLLRRERLFRAVLGMLDPFPHLARPVVAAVQGV